MNHLNWHHNCLPPCANAHTGSLIVTFGHLLLLVLLLLEPLDLVEGT
jgi:hypothetical protein